MDTAQIMKDGFIRSQEIPNADWKRLLWEGERFWICPLNDESFLFGNNVLGFLPLCTWGKVGYLNSSFDLDETRTRKSIESCDAEYTAFFNQFITNE